MAEMALLALPRDRAAQLSGFSARQLDYWEKTGLLQPQVSERLTAHRSVRLYGYTELMSLLVIAELRRRKVTLQHIRRIVTHLKARGYPEPLTQVRYATYGDAVYFQDREGDWASDIAPDQLVLHEVLVLSPLMARIKAANERDPGTYGRIDRHRGTMGSKPLIAGTRVPVQTIQRYLSHGASVAQVIEAYPALVRQDVEAAQREAAVA